MSIGIVGYGVYIPRWRLKGKDIAQAWGTDWEKVFASLAVHEKSVPGIDEDTTTLAISASQNALAQAQIEADAINALFIGSESHVYAVKPTTTMVCQALGLNKFTYSADLEFACKSGTAALLSCCAFVGAGMSKYALAIGADTAQAAPGDVLEYTAAAGGAAFILGSKEEECIAVIEHTCSITTDTPDFWRRPQESYPEHTGRFTGEPAYFYHVLAVAQELLGRANLKTTDIDHVIFHQPNGRFPVIAAKRLGLSKEKLNLGLLSPLIGNAYSAATLLGLAAVLDQALPNQRILVVSYGSGSGADAMILRTTEKIELCSKLVPTTLSYISTKSYVTYQQYQKNTN